MKITRDDLKSLSETCPNGITDTMIFETVKYRFRLIVSATRGERRTSVHAYTITPGKSIAILVNGQYTDGELLEHGWEDIGRAFGCDAEAISYIAECLNTCFLVDK